MDATVTVTDTDDVGGETITIEFATPAGFDARPGQFLKLTASVDGESYSRFYTLSSPDVAETFEITVGIDPEESGPFSEFLAALSAGDELAVSGPFGSDYYEDEPRVVVLAGGPGIGPAVGIAERALADGGAAAIVYRDDDPAHADRLASLEAGGASITVLESDGDLTGAVERALTGAADEQVFIYGFGDFLSAAETALADAGGDPTAAKTENFG
jgi:cytochrome-b5 reductase